MFSELTETPWTEGKPFCFCVPVIVVMVPLKVSGAAVLSECNALRVVGDWIWADDVRAAAKAIVTTRAIGRHRIANSSNQKLYSRESLNAGKRALMPMAYRSHPSHRHKPCKNRRTGPCPTGT